VGPESARLLRLATGLKSGEIFQEWQSIGLSFRPCCKEAFDVTGYNSLRVQTKAVFLALRD
jgi:hypothetical protein